MRVWRGAKQIIFVLGPPWNVRRVADGVDEAVRGGHDFLDGETVWDEERADEESPEKGDRHLEGSEPVPFFGRCRRWRTRWPAKTWPRSWPACEPGSRGNCAARTARSRSSATADAGRRPA